VEGKRGRDTEVAGREVDKHHRLIRAVRQRAAAAGSMSKVTGSTSANTGVPPQSPTPFAVATTSLARHDHFLARTDAESGNNQVKSGSAARRRSGKRVAPRRRAPMRPPSCPEGASQTSAGPGRLAILRHPHLREAIEMRRAPIKLRHQCDDRILLERSALTPRCTANPRGQLRGSTGSLRARRRA